MLSQELRPKKWEDVAGQKENINILKAIVRDPENSPKCLIFQGAFGSGKCVVGDTRVETSLGYIKIKDLIKNPVFDEEGFMDISDRDIRVLDNKLATHFFYGGKADTVRIQSKFFDLEGTREHKVKCLTDSGVEWVELKDLKVGDLVCVSSDSKKEILFNNDVLLAPRLKETSRFESGYLFGMALQIGEIREDTGRLIFTGSLDVMDLFLNIFDGNSFSSNYKISGKSEKKGLEFTLSKNTRRGKGKVETLDSPLFSWLCDLGLRGRPSNRDVPEIIYQSNSYFLSGVLSAMFDNGCRLPDYYSNLCISYTHKNPKIVRLFTDITRLFGVSCSLIEIGKSKRLTAFIKDRKGMNDFTKIISPKNKAMDEKLNSEIQNFGDCKSNLLMPKNTYIINELDKLVSKVKYEYCSENSSGWSSFVKDTGMLNVLRNRGDFIRESSLETVIDLLKDKENDDSDLVRHFNHYRFIAIENIEYGRNEVYDLTVEDSHCFIANSLLNHNTTSARILARELNKVKDTEFDIVDSKYYYEFDSTVIGNVDAIRSLREEFTVSYGDYWRVVVLDEAHAVSNAAQNALLKMLEETTGKTIYIMATTEVNKLLPTIRSRSLELQFNPVPEDDIIKNISSVCEDRNIEISEDVKRLIAERSYGHMRNAHMMLDKYLLIGEEDFIDSVKSAVSLYCDFLIAIYDNDRDKVLDTINSLMDIPINNLQSDWNTVMIESLKSFCGFTITSSDIKRLVSKYGTDFNMVSSCYMSSWIRNAFKDMSYFQATFLNLFMVIRGALNKKQADTKQINTANSGNIGNRFGNPVR